MALWDDTPSDGVFHFYWAESEEFEYAYGPFDSFEDAKANALKQAAETTFGPEPGVTIYVSRADKRTTVPPEFDTQALIAEYRETGAFRFDSEKVLELFMEANEDCWGEDGWDGLTGDAEAAEIALIKGLLDASNTWLLHHRHLEIVTAEEDLQRLLQDAVRAWEVQHRAQIKTWLFGRLEDSVTFVIPELTPAQLQDRVVRTIQRQFGISYDEALEVLRGNHETITASLRSAEDTTE